jgi:transcription elongation factor Elf1
MLIATDLSAAVDVYSDWIDACDAVAKDAAGGEGPSAGRLGRPASPGYESDGGVERDDAADLLDDEIGEAEYND